MRNSSGGSRKNGSVAPTAVIFCQICQKGKVMPMPRYIRVCTFCWRGLDYESLGRPPDVQYKCTECGAIHEDTKTMLSIEQLCPKYGREKGDFVAKNSTECPQCKRMVQFTAKDCRQGVMTCPSCGSKHPRVNLAIYALIDKTGLKELVTR